MQQISDYERELMKVIWGNGGTALYAEIAEALAEKGKPWTKNTIITLLSRLIDKGYLKTSKIGRRNQYTAQIPEEEYRITQTEHFVKKIYEGDVRGLLSALIRTDRLTAEDCEALRDYWEKAGKRHE